MSEKDNWKWQKELLIKRDKEHQKEIERLNKRVKECEEAYLRTRHQYSELEGKYVVNDHIINELENYCEEKIIEYNGEIKIIDNTMDKMNLLGARSSFNNILDKLQELKGDSSNEQIH